MKKKINFTNKSILHISYKVKKILLKYNFNNFDGPDILKILVLIRDLSELAQKGNRVAQATLFTMFYMSDHVKHGYAITDKGIYTPTTRLVYESRLLYTEGLYDDDQITIVIQPVSLLVDYKEPKKQTDGKLKYGYIIDYNEVKVSLDTSTWQIIGLDMLESYDKSNGVHPFDLELFLNHEEQSLHIISKDVRSLPAAYLFDVYSVDVRSR